MNVPFHETVLLDIGIVLLLIVLGYFIFFLLNRILTFIYKKDDKKSDEGCFAYLLKFLFFISLVFFCITFIGFSALVQTYNIFDGTKLIAEVVCEPIPGDRNTMSFRITYKDGAIEEPTTQFLFQGDEWFVQGDIIKWSDGFSLFGLSKWYKITKLGNITQQSIDKRIRYRTVYDLTKDEIPQNWRWLYNFGKNMPFADGLYGIRISHPPDSQFKYEIYVSSEGFSINPITKD